MSDAQIDFDKEMVGTVAVEERDALDLDRLTEWFAANVEGFAGPISYSKFKGGQSNPTYRIDTPGRSYVLRRQPFGKLLPSAHAVDREYTAMAALGPTGFPVPKTYGLCEDPEVLGSKFFVMGLADGRSLWNGALPDCSPAERREIYLSMIDTFADLHLKDPVAIGLGEFGKPTDYCARQIARWTKQYKLSETEHMPKMERLIEWLPQTIPPQHGSSVVHGDYRSRREWRRRAGRPGSARRRSARSAGSARPAPRPARGRSSAPPRRSPESATAMRRRPRSAA
ncbi:phosphotransferase family protein [Leptolyngbya sp. 15MV]|nr:phosphotransferase family protein [Leptolyngbya sp. 15MV]